MAAPTTTQTLLYYLVDSIYRHEMAHWQQFLDMGAPPFYYHYIKGYIEHGRFDHPMEKEAREMAVQPE